MSIFSSSTDSSLMGLKGSLQGENFSLSKNKFSLGRANDQDINIPDEKVSRRHAAIYSMLGGFFIKDLNSTNGTFVNGVRVSFKSLKDNDRIRIGEAEFLFAKKKNLTGALGQYGGNQGQIGAVRRGQKIKSFETIKIIGFGGFSTAYLARALPDGFNVVVKVPNPAIKSKQEFMLRFKREAKISMKLEHPNIVTIFDYGEFKDGTPYIVMEYLQGRSLREDMDLRSLGISQAKSIMTAIANAIKYAHQKKVIHRDIKPENIKANHSGQYKLMDFGIAREMDEISYTMTGMIIGTPFYMAPEQAMSSKKVKIDGRCDIYSLGAMFYEMVTGRVPFEGAAYDVIKKHLYSMPVPPRRINSSVPVQVENVIMRCLQKEPSRRYQSMDDFIRDLNANGHSGQSVSTGRTHSFNVPGFSAKKVSATQRIMTIIKSPYGVGTVIPLSPRQPLTIGRAKGNGLQIPWDRSISANHARISYVNGEYFLEDCSSTTGTFLNSIYIQKAKLNPHDQIQIGKIVLLFN